MLQSILLQRLRWGTYGRMGFGSRRHPYSDDDTYCNARGKYHAKSITHTHCNRHGYSYSYSHADGNRYSHSYGNAYTDGDGYCDGYCDSYSNCYGDNDRHCYSDGHGYCDGDGYSCSYSHGNGHGHSHVYAHAAAKKYARTKAASDSHASAVSGDVSWWNVLSSVRDGCDRALRLTRWGSNRGSPPDITPSAIYWHRLRRSRSTFG
jgi:hypothetical protein